MGQAKAAALAALVALTACDAAQSDAKRMVQDQLTDPGSAQFREIITSDKVVCGEVNAKNRMGGYVGFKRFVVDRESKSVSIAPDAPGDLRLPEEQAKAYQGISFDLEKWAACPR